MAKLASFYYSYFLISVAFVSVLAFSWESVSLFVYGISLFSVLFFLHFISSQWIWKKKLSPIIYEIQKDDLYGNIIWIKDPTPWMRPIRSWGSQGYILCSLGCALFWSKDQFERKLQESWIQKNKTQCLLETQSAILIEGMNQLFQSPTNWISWIWFGWIKSMKMKLQRGS